MPMPACCRPPTPGLLLAEVNINLLRSSGAASVPLNAMAARTLGAGGAAAASTAYVLLSYSLLVAYVSKGGELVASATGLLPLPAAAGFAAALAGLCFNASQRTLDRVNGGLVALVVASFAGLLAAAGGGVDADALLTHADWAAVPATLPVCCLAFVFHNVVGFIVTSLRGGLVAGRGDGGYCWRRALRASRVPCLPACWAWDAGDVAKVRSAVCAGEWQCGKLAG